MDFLSSLFSLNRQKRSNSRNGGVSEESVGNGNEEESSVRVNCFVSIIVSLLHAAEILLAEVERLASDSLVHVHDIMHHRLEVRGSIIAL